MIEKEKILEAWIMVEHLSEGDIRIKDTSPLTPDGLQEQDFHALLRHEMEKKKITSKKNGGIVVYFDIFSFREVVSILREQYRLEPTNEDIQFGNKFSFALYFDKDLNFLPDMTFFTESAYIRYFKEVPNQEAFREFEDELKQSFTQDFDGTAASPKKFNEAFQKELQRYGTGLKNCRMQVLSSVETEGTNLHSFFIGDLEKAKETDTDNLRAYLYGQSGERVNLDSKNSSPHFNPGAFEEILRPENYPLGRFPSKTKFALSLMQQVAVNLSTGADPQPVRSVNGPPGTGKTTLLKDIFAQLVVQQACDIAKLSEHTIAGTEETVYFNSASIGVLPARITENHIVVASSNNGAVQNIVNELPLCQGIEETLLEDLKQADYFREISNAKVSSQWKKDENGKNREELTLEAGKGEENRWGVFSLEGGRSDNMTNILTHIKHMCKYLEEEYLPPAEDVYTAFLRQYEQVRSLRAQVQAAADSIQARQGHALRLEQARAAYQAESARRKKGLEEGLREQGETGRACGQRLQELQRSLEEVQSRREAARESRRSLEQCLDLLKEQKPGLFSEKGEREQYISRLGVISDQLIALGKQDEACIRQESALRREIGQCQKEQRQCAENQDGLQKQFAAWRGAEEARISGLEQKVRECEAVRDRTRIEPLNMGQDYDALQLSNPWFDEAYRTAQSKLFLAALRVRKHFLFENRRNLRAAVSIWSQQEKHVDRPLLIEAAWNWINLAIPVISSTFASFSRMCRHLGPETLGHLFIDEAGQALPQAAVGAVYRSRHVMVVGDPSQIKPVLTLDSNTLATLGMHFGVTEKYLSASASAQTLVDAASRYGFYRKRDLDEDSWIGIPLWVHRRCQCPMFDISNKISYDGFMVQGMAGSGKYGKTGWFDVGGKASNKYVEEQGEFLAQKIKELMEQDPRIKDPKEKDVIYVITPFANAAYQLAQKLRGIGFTRYAQGKPTNVGTVHTFQGKEAPVVFFVLGADKQSSGAAQWAVSEPNMMNVAATRAKKEFYIIGDRKLYLSLNCDVANDTDRIIRQYKADHPELVEDTVNMAAAKKAGAPPRAVPPPEAPAPAAAPQARTAKAPVSPPVMRMTGTVKYLGKGRDTFFAYVSGDDGDDYSIPESIFSKTENAKDVIQKGKKVSFIRKEGKKNPLATDVKPASQGEA